ncbi:MAG: aminotransferase class I/II-fold pyridoxal phosphate-dependent enzyme [Acidobacteria bacterium]|nr:aminotransferase class I/II-fold pyridoxal phosphate-dependent enzyme [Acidobacteriota bacterium]
MSFVPPPYPYERLDGLRESASRLPGGSIDCSIGTPVDAPPDFVIDELARASGARGYPPSAGTPRLRDAAAGWLHRRFGVEQPSSELAACVGTKEFVASLATYLHLRRDDRDTVLYPAISYPTYAMGATLAGLRAVEVPLRDGALDLAAVAPDDVRRALVLWSNSPSNPTGDLDDLGAVARWGRENDVLVASDECYADFTWQDHPRSILQHGSENVIAVHSISKRSNLAGVRAGFYAGDADVVSYLRLVRQHAGLMVAAPVQAAVAAAYDNDEHVERQRDVYYRRLHVLGEALRAARVRCPAPQGSFYLWCSREGMDGWQLAAWLAEVAGLIVSPGELYGPGGGDFARIAMVQPDDRIELAAQRLRELA